MNNLIQIFCVIFILLFGQFSLKGQKSLFGIVDNYLVKVDENTGQISDQIEIIGYEGHKLRNLVYVDKDNLFYSISKIGNNNYWLCSISPVGLYKRIGKIEIPNKVTYHAEGLAYNENLDQLFVSTSLNAGSNTGDYFSESLVVLDRLTAKGAFVKSIENSFTNADMDKICFDGNVLILLDLQPNIFSNVYKMSINSDGDFSEPILDFQVNEYYQVWGLTYFKSKLYAVAEQFLYEKLNEKIGKIKNEDNSVSEWLTGLTSANIPKKDDFEQNCEGEYEVDLDKNLLLHYDLNNNAIDQSGNDFNGTMIDISGVEDRFGTENGAIYFNGASNFIFPENDKLQPQFPISISVWAYFEKEEKFTHAIMNTNFVENNYHGIILTRFFEYGNISISYGGGLGNTGPDNRRSAITKIGVPIQEWVHIVGIISGPEEFEIYINGCNQELTYSGYGPTEIVYDEHPGQLGLHDSNTLPEYPNNALVGALDDFYFWDRTISEEEILYLYDGFYTKPIDIEPEYIILNQEPVQIALDTKLY